MAGRVVLPGFVNAHLHVIHNLLRGGLSDDRALYDWLLNVASPGEYAYTAEDAKVVAHRNGTMLTIHVAESRFDRLQYGVSSVEYLTCIVFLSPDVLAGHCVQVDYNGIWSLRWPPS